MFLQKKEHGHVENKVAESQYDRTVGSGRSRDLQKCILPRFCVVKDWRTGQNGLARPIAPARQNQGLSQELTSRDWPGRTGLKQTRTRLTNSR